MIALLDDTGWQTVPGTEDARLDATYRSTYFLSGPFPPTAVRVAITDAVQAAANASGRVKVVGFRFLTAPQVASVYGSSLGPRTYNAWAFQVSWRKVGGGTPLAILANPLALAIVGVVVLIVGVVVVGHVVERLNDRLGPRLPELAAAGVAVVALIVVGIAASRGGR